jgi:3-oxoacyl-[acyl-carrier protein] reductase
MKFDLQKLTALVTASTGNIVAFICSQRAAIINGSNIRAEGGLVRSAF